MSDPRLQRLNETENLAVGLATGVVDVSLTQWMLYCKNASQQGMPLTLNPKVLYRGTGMSMVNMSVLSGLQLPLTATCQGLFTGGVPRKLSDGELVGAGLIGGEPYLLANSEHGILTRRHSLVRNLLRH